MIVERNNLRMLLDSNGVSSIKNIEKNDHRTLLNRGGVTGEEAKA